MKMKQQFGGIKLELMVKEGEPICSKERWEGMTEDTKVKTLNEIVNIQGVKVELGEFVFEYEVTADETIQFVKNIKEISSILRAEVPLWVQTIENAVNGTRPTSAAPEQSGAPAAEPTVEDNPAVEVSKLENLKTTIEEALEKIKAKIH